MTHFEGPVRDLPTPVTREEALQGLRALAFLHESGRLTRREIINAADNIFIDMGLGHVSLPYLELERFSALDVLHALEVALTYQIDVNAAEYFQPVPPRWPFRG